MSYGFISYNGDDEVVVNDTQPTYTKVRSGVLTGGDIFTYPTNALSTYGYTLTGNAVLSGNELILFELGVGDWLCGTFMFASSGHEVYSNSPTLSYSVFAPRNEAGNPSGYGMAVFNQNSECMWDSTTLLSRIYQAEVLPASTFPDNNSGYTSSTFNFSGGAFIEGGATYLRLNTVTFDITIWGHVLERTSSTEARITVKKLYATTNSHSGTNAFARSGMVYMVGST